MIYHLTFSIKSTNQNKMLIRKDYLKMARRLAWSFHYTTGIDPEELYSEACVALCEALDKYNGNGKADKTTYLYASIRNGLIIFCRHEHRYYLVDHSDQFDQITETIFDFEDFVISFDSSEKEIIDLIYKNIEEFNHLLDQPYSPTKSYLTKLLREKGWQWKNIWSGYKNLKSCVNLV